MVQAMATLKALTKANDRTRKVWKMSIEFRYWPSHREFQLEIWHGKEATEGFEGFTKDPTQE